MSRHLIRSASIWDRSLDQRSELRIAPAISTITSPTGPFLRSKYGPAIAKPQKSGPFLRPNKHR